MVDISMCADTRCPSRTICYRYTAEPEPRYQSYEKFGRKKGHMRCEDFWENRFEDMNEDMLDALRKRDKEGIKSQKRILKELSQKHTNICDKGRKHGR